MHNSWNISKFGWYLKISSCTSPFIKLYNSLTIFTLYKMVTLSHTWVSNFLLQTYEMLSSNLINQCFLFIFFIFDTVSSFEMVHRSDSWNRLPLRCSEICEWNLHESSILRRVRHSYFPFVINLLICTWRVDSFEDFDIILERLDRKLQKRIR